MQRIMGMTAALMLASTATAAMAEPTDVEQLKLRPEKFVGQTVAIDGIVFVADLESALLRFKAGKLADGNFVFNWPDRGAMWEFAQYECSGAEKLPKCKAHVVGELKKNEMFADTYFIEAQQVEFTAAK